jgi:biopolymer transport protein ExbD
MGRRRRKTSSQEEVQLNLTAMLDMAFQLLAFFILTFRSPGQIEGQILLRMPPPQAITVVKGGQAVGSDLKNTNPLSGVNTLTISVFADPKTGDIAGLGVGEAPVANVSALDRKLQEVFADPGNPFDQVIIQVSDSCRYEELMKVIDVCTRQSTPDGKKLSKLSFVALPDGQ